MIEQIIQEVLTTATGLLLLLGAWLVNFLTGVSKIIFGQKKWSWKKFFESVAKAVLMAVATLAWVVVMEGVNWFATKCGADIAAILEGASVAGVFGGIIGGSAYFLINAYKNIIKFLGTDHLIEVNNTTEVGKEIVDKFFTTKEAAEAHKKAEEEHEKIGGLGQYYSVPIDNYDVFRNTVMGKGYDIDNAYSYQCWDGAALLWQQLGRWLSTGGMGGAKHCWTHAREENAGEDFDLIYNLADVKRGDVVVYGWGEWGHIGYADEDYNGGAYISTLGQNQGGDMTFCVVNCVASGFIGAFRLKRWHSAPTPTPTPVKEDFKVGDVVIPTRLVDYNGTPLIQWDDWYTIAEISGDRAVLTAPRNGQQVVWAAMRTSDLQKA